MLLSEKHVGMSRWVTAPRRGRQCERQRESGECARLWLVQRNRFRQQQTKDLLRRLVSQAVGAMPSCAPW